MATFEQDSIFVIARMNDAAVRRSIEEAFVRAFTARNIQAYESYKTFPVLTSDGTLDEERKQEIKNYLETKGYDGVVLTTVKDKEMSNVNIKNGFYVGMSYLDMYLDYYGSLYDYYSYPYSGRPNSVSPSLTATSTKYILETVGYNLTPVEELVFVVNSKVNDPKDLDKAADSYVETIVKTLIKRQ